MRLLICAGGTGGGVYPALAVLEALWQRNKARHTLWVGSQKGMDAELVRQAGIPYRSIPAAGLHGVGVTNLPTNLWQLARGYFAARRILVEFKPDALFFTGGYVAVPVALAGMRLNSLLYVPDIEPGLALRTLSRLSDHIALTTETSRAFFNPRTPSTVTGYPTRSALRRWTKSEALRRFGLSPDLPVLLVTGGSLGTRSINHAVMNILSEILKEIQVIHLTGRLDWDEVEANRIQLPEKLLANYKAFPYLHTQEMSAALNAASLVLSRAGGSTLGEYPLLGLPAILVPYPHAWRYQKVNAEYLASRGAAVVIADEDLSSQLLLTINSLIDSPGRLQAMSQAMASQATPQAAEKITDLLIELARSSEEKRK